jgi:hypothetical protein
MSIHDYVAQHSDRFTHLSDSLLRVMQAVSANEGKLEAINTWDNAFLTFGCFQWTAGTGDSAGELPALIARLKKEKPKAFDTFFKEALRCCSTSTSTGLAMYQKYSHRE